MFNVDRWAVYTAQKLKIPVGYVLSGRYNGHWSIITPAQRRRLNKKARKNNDQSIGIF